MSRALLDYQFGLGDHLLCSGLVHEYAKKYDSVDIFCNSSYTTSVSFLFRNLPNVHLLHAEGPAPKGRILERLLHHARGDTVRYLYADEETGIECERQYYGIAGIPIAKKWESFPIHRDLERERSFFERVVPQEPYIFVHYDNRFPMDEKRIASALPLVRSNSSLTENIFDYGLVIERASEIHVMESSFMYLVDLLRYENKNQKLFSHRYARPLPLTRLPLLKKNWNILIDL